jgi:DNA-binding XRE family transcriptional regulator
METEEGGRKPPTTLAELTDWLGALPPVERAKVAAVLVDARTVVAVAEIRRAAIHEATRHTSRAEVAAELGVSRQAIGKAITEHLKTQEKAMITIAELAVSLGLPASAQERVARFADAFTDPADYAKTGRVAPRWAGQGLDATFTHDEAEEIEAEWHRTATAIEAGAILPYINEAETEADLKEIAERYQP